MDQVDRYDPDAFDFLGPPFAAPVGGDLLLTVPQENVLSATLAAFGRGSGLVLIAGDAGSGRTLLADAITDSLCARGLVVDQIAQTGGLGSGALLARLVPRLGIARERLAPVLTALAATARGVGQDGAGPRGTLAAGWGDAGNAGWSDAAVIDREWSGAAPDPGPAGTGRASAQQASALAVVVDDAGTWSEADLLLLASLAGLGIREAPLLQAVLIGDAALERQFGALCEAVDREGGGEAVSLRISPLTLRQGEEYLAQRFAAAGGSLQRTMSPGAVGEILLRCGGNPGRIDQLADDCLAVTARRRRRYVTATVVRTARQVPRTRRRLSGPAAYALLGAAGGVLAAGAGVALLLSGWTRPLPAPSRDDAALFAGTGRFAAPVPPPASVAALPAAPRPYTWDYPAQGFARTVPPLVVEPQLQVPQPRALQPPVALAAAPPAPVSQATTFPDAPALPGIVPAEVEAAAVSIVLLPILSPRVTLVPAPVAPLLAAAEPPPLLATLPVLPPVPDWPAQVEIAVAPDNAPGQGVPSSARGLSTTEATQAHAADAPALPVPLRLGLAPRVSPAIQPPTARRDGPVVMHVARRRDTASSLLRVKGEVMHDNPAGQAPSDVPYFCRSISPQNGAEEAYTRQVCGR